MKSTKIMLLGILLVLIGVALAQPENGGFIYRTFLFVPPQTFTIVSPLVSLLFILVGIIIGLVGYFLKS